MPSHLQAMATSGFPNPCKLSRGWRSCQREDICGYRIGDSQSKEGGQSQRRLEWLQPGGPMGMYVAQGNERLGAGWRSAGPCGCELKEGDGEQHFQLFVYLWYIVSKKIEDLIGFISDS